VRANVSNKLTVIVDQIKYLQEQARKVFCLFVVGVTFIVISM